MSTVLIVSDIHGRADRLERVLASHPEAQALFFLGDGEREVHDVCRSFPQVTLFAVRGNCDVFSSLPDELPVELFGRRFFLAHGHRFGVKGGLGHLCRIGYREGYDALLFGHTHQRLLQYVSDGEKPFYLFNPGSLGHPDDRVPSYGVLTVTARDLLFSHGEL